MPPSGSSLELLPDLAQETLLSCLGLKDLAALGACSRALRALLARQPEAVWKAAAESDPAYPRRAQQACCWTRCSLTPHTTSARAGATLCTGPPASAAPCASGIVCTGTSPRGLASALTCRTSPSELSSKNPAWPPLTPVYTRWWTTAQPRRRSFCKT